MNVNGPAMFGFVKRLAQAKAIDAEAQRKSQNVTNAFRGGRRCYKHFTCGATSMLRARGSVC